MYFQVSFKKRNNGLDFPTSDSSRQGYVRISSQCHLPSRAAQKSGRDRYVNSYDNEITEVGQTQLQSTNTK